MRQTISGDVYWRVRRKGAVAVFHCQPFHSLLLAFCLLLRHAGRIAQVHEHATQAPQAFRLATARPTAGPVCRAAELGSDPSAATTELSAVAILNAEVESFLPAHCATVLPLPSAL